MSRPSSFYSPCFRTLFFSLRSWTIFFSGSRVSLSKGFGPELPRAYLTINMTKPTQIIAKLSHILGDFRAAGCQQTLRPLRPLPRYTRSSSAFISDRRRGWPMRKRLGDGPGSSDQSASWSVWEPIRWRARPWCFITVIESEKSMIHVFFYD